jgi:hypothetical protein
MGNKFVQQLPVPIHDALPASLIALQVRKEGNGDPAKQHIGSRLCSCRFGAGTDEPPRYGRLSP